MATLNANGLRLGFLLFDYFPFGGLQRDCLKVARRCAALGADVTLFTRTWQGDQPADLCLELFGRQGWSNVSRNRHWVQRLRRELPHRGMDGIIGFNKLPGLDVYYGSDPCFVAKHRRLKSAWVQWLPRYRHFAALEKEVFDASSKTEILLLTPQEIPVYREIYGTSSERFHVLPPGIDRAVFSLDVKKNARALALNEMGWAPDTKILLLVGSGFRVKGLDRAIDALASLPVELRKVSQLVVIGQNRPEPFNLQANRLGVGSQVHFLGGRDDVRNWQLAADLLVHPAYSESAGMVLLEALSVGLPVLTTDTCGYAFHIQTANAGVVLPSPYQQIECNQAMVRMLTSPDAISWSANGLHYAATQDLYGCHEQAVNIILSTITRLAAEKNTSH